MGFVPRVEPEQDWSAFSEFLESWAFSRKHGLDAFIAIHGVPDGEWLDACGILDAELDELEAAELESAKGKRGPH